LSRNGLGESLEDWGMRIEELRDGAADGDAFVAATVVWERRRRPPLSVSIATDSRLQPDLSVSADAFLLGTALVAMEHRERRISIDGTVDSRLISGLANAMRVLAGWYRDVTPIEIEAAEVVVRPTPTTPGRVAMTMSGGIDSLATLRHNHQTHPVGDPGRVRDAIVVAEGFDAFDMGGSYFSRLEAIARDAGVELIPVRTNLRMIEPSDSFFLNKYHGAFLAGVAHVFHTRISQVLIASSYDTPNLHSWGSHPELDPGYGTDALRVRHDLGEMSRFDKTALIATWPAAMSGLRVCLRSEGGPNGEPNCGECEKCLRTLLALTALGMPQAVSSFPKTTVAPDDVAAVGPMTSQSAPFYRELVEPLRAADRLDLVEAIDVQLAAYERQRRSLSSRMRSAERTVLHGAIRRMASRARLRRAAERR
jgi:hypothetical protein